MKIKNNKIFMSFLLSYIIVLIVPSVLIGTLIISLISNVLEGEIKSSTLFALHQARQNIDTRVKELDAISYQLSNNRNLRTLLYDNDLRKIDEYLTISKFNNDLHSIAGTNNFISNIYVYSQKRDYFLSPTTVFSSEMFYQLYPYENQSRDEWLQKVRAFRDRGFWPSTSVGEVTARDGMKVLTYIRSIPVDKNQSDGSVIAMINDENLKGLFETGINSYSLKGSYYIVDNHREVVFSTEDQSSQVLSSPIIKATGEENFLQYKIAGKSYIAVCVNSNIMPWKYIGIIPYNLYMSKINRIRSIMILLIIVCLFLGLILAYYLSIREFKPIKEIFNSILKINKDKQINIKEDFSTIVETIQGTFEKYQNLEDILKQQLPNIRLNLIVKLLKGQYKAQAEVDEMLNLLEIGFKSGRFGVTIISIDDCSEFINENHENRLELVKFWIIKIAEELISRNNVVLSYEEDGKIILIINFDTQPELENYQELANTVKQIMEFIDEKFQIILSAGIGNIYEGFTSIPQSFEEAKIALNRKFIDGRNLLTFYHKISTNRNSYYYPMDIEIQIMNLVKTGDYQGASLLLDNIYDENFGKRKLALNLVNCLSFDMIGTILKVFDGININYEELFKEKSDISDRLLQCETALDMHNEIKSILKKVCEYITEKRESNNVELKEKLLQYINTNYFDKNLSLQSISDYFKMSNSYLSRFFKDHTGYNFGDYLARVRIKKAKELMAEGVSITEVSNLVGYNSVNSFIRTFKRYESVTPGQFKEESKIF
jgi:two-component system response regulator YesN